uniref:Putative nuclease HARBI1 n=1 Tax=Catharus ustulatus TaxID=91951 RepID=A0A8C3UZL2_CATUS
MQQRRAGSEGGGGAYEECDGSVGQSERGEGAWPGGAAEPGGSEREPGQTGTERDQTGPNGTNRDRRDQPGPTGETGTDRTNRDRREQGQEPGQGQTALRRCRLDRAAIAALCRELGADLQSLTGRSHALPVAVKVTSALAFLASGSFQTASRLSTGISQSAMSNCLAQFLAALQRRAPRYIAFPPPPAPPGDPPALPGVLGLVGAMHVALRAPADNEPLFRNAANFHSINMQVVCDRHGAITNVVAKFPGSCANATVLENSALARLMEGSRMEGVWLLGDRTYPLKPWLLTPISGPRGAAELRYNALHSRTLDPLRRTLGLLRHRFRCLAGGGLQYSPPKVCQIFLACCILHNIALRRRVPLEPPEGLPRRTVAMTTRHRK